MQFDWILFNICHTLHTSHAQVGLEGLHTSHAQVGLEGLHTSHAQIGLEGQFYSSERLQIATVARKKPPIGRQNLLVCQIIKLSIGLSVDQELETQMSPPPGLITVKGGHSPLGGHTPPQHYNTSFADMKFTVFVRFSCFPYRTTKCFDWSCPFCSHDMWLTSVNPLNDCLTEIQRLPKERRVHCAIK